MQIEPRKCYGAVSVNFYLLIYNNLNIVISTSEPKVPGKTAFQNQNYVQIHFSSIIPKL